MAYAKPENGTNQLQMNQRKPASVQIPFWRHSHVGYLVCLPLVGLALLGSLLEQQLGLHATSPARPFCSQSCSFHCSGGLVQHSLPSWSVCSFSIICMFRQLAALIFTPGIGFLQVLPFILSGALIAIITAQRETARRRALVAEQEVNDLC